MNPKYQELRIDKVIQHEKWDASKFQEGNDIALVRVRKHIKLFVSMIRLVHTVMLIQCYTPSKEKIRFLYFNHLSKEFLEQMIPHLKALI